MPLKKERGSGSFLRWVWMALAAAAIYKEMKLPPEERTWHGEVAGFVPYDFRVPTMDRMRDRLWNPEGPLVGPHVFGVGWAVNFGRAWHMAKDAIDSAKSPA